jgi:hypothetical protein
VIFVQSNGDAIGKPIETSSPTLAIREHAAATGRPMAEGPMDLGSLTEGRAI